MGSFHKTHPPIAPSRFTRTLLPRISIVVPARNEEKNISNCLRHLINQTYANYEIVVVDDRSTDRTPEIIEDIKRSSKISIKNIRIEKLPPGWTGKNHAVFAGSKLAQGEWFLFTDADTTHAPESLETALAFSTENNIDFLTLAPEVESKSFWEETIQPLAVASLALWFDPEKINNPQSRVTLANGQFIFVKKDVYEQVGGNEAVKTEVIEDVELAKKVRAAGFIVKFLNGTRLYSTRMYTSLNEIKTGWTRIFTHLFNKNIPAILHKIFLFLFFSLLPFAAFFFEVYLRIALSENFSPSLFWLSLSLCFWIILVRFFGNKAVKANPWYAFLHPLGSLVMVWILSACVMRILLNQKSLWKGQSY